VGLSRDLLDAGRFFSLDESNDVVLGSDIVSKLGFESPESAIGKEIKLTTGGLVPTSGNEFELQDQDVSLNVVGVYTPPRFASSMSADSILLPVDIMRKMPSSWMEHGLKQLRAQDGQLGQGYHTVIVRTKSPGDVVRVERKVKAMGFATLSVMDRMKEMQKFFVFMEILLSAVGTVALVVAGLGILNTLTMTVIERYQEIGIYKSIGASHGDIRWLFLVEAAAVGFLGGVGGLMLARVVSWILGWAFNTYAARQGVDGPEAVFIFPLWLLVGAVVYSIVISIVSGLYPASKAANIDPIQALRRG
jgi:putative ABC transport system permease protein